MRVWEREGGPDPIGRERMQVDGRIHSHDWQMEMENHHQKGGKGNWVRVRGGCGGGL